MPDQLKDLHFPKSGLDISMAFSAQPNRPAWNGEYARTTPLGVNVRGWEPLTGRIRGGSRTGLRKYIPLTPGNITWITQELNLIVRDGSGAVQPSQSGRVVTLVAVSQGNVFGTQPGGTTWTEATNLTVNTPPLNISGLVYSSANNQKLWFVDGTHYCVFDPTANTVSAWTASQGTMPVDSAGNTARLICTWRGRQVLSGLVLDPQNWFMSAVSDPTNWNYNPISITPTQAIAGNKSPLGFIGDVVTTLIPYTDDVLVFGGDHTIYMMQGDPMAGGQIDLVSDAIGMAWGIPWCKDPYGNIYFVSNKTGIYTLVPGQQPQRISQPIEQLLHQIDTGANGIRLLWSDRFQGLHVFVTLLANPAPTIHFFYEVRSGAWWTDVFANSNHNPLCCVTLDGNTPGDRVPLIGSWDGYVRAIDSAANDDGTPIYSSTLIGPLLTTDLDDMMLYDMQAILGETSAAVNYAVFVGSSAEHALANPPVATGTWQPGRNLDTFVRRAGHAIYVQLSSSSQWAMEAIRCRLGTLGKVRRRGK
jgi:hypothetical protein